MFFIKTSYYYFLLLFLFLFSVWIFDFICLWVSSYHRISNKYFSWPTFDVNFAKNILVLSNPDSITNFKFRSFLTRFNFFSQSRRININRFFVNRTVINIIVLILLFMTKIIFTVLTVIFYIFYPLTFHKPLSNNWLTFIMNRVH